MEKSKDQWIDLVIVMLCYTSLPCLPGHSPPWFLSLCRAWASTSLLGVGMDSLDSSAVLSYNTPELCPGKAHTFPLASSQCLEMVWMWTTVQVGRPISKRLLCVAPVMVDAVVWVKMMVTFMVLPCAVHSTISLLFLSDHHFLSSLTSYTFRGTWLLGQEDMDGIYPW